MEMDQLQAMRQALALERLAGGDEVRGREAEFRVLSAAGRPFSRALALEAHPQADQRLDADLPRHLEDGREFLELLDDHEDFLPQLPAHERVLDEEVILVAVADDKALGVRVKRQGGHEFRLAAGFESEMVRGAGVDDLLDDLTQLVDLDRENAAINILVIGLADRVGERPVDPLDAVPQQILEPDQQREYQATGPRFVDDLHDVDPRSPLLHRLDLDVAPVVDRKIAGTPPVDVVQ